MVRSLNLKRIKVNHGGFILTALISSGNMSLIHSLIPSLSRREKQFDSPLGPMFLMSDRDFMSSWLVVQ
jgi:hypothetical protein